MGGKAAKAKAQSEKEESKAQDIYTEENEPNLGDDDLRSTKLPNITHPPPDGPHGIEDDAPNFRVTRSSKRAALLAAVEISGSCPSPQQAAGRRYPCCNLTVKQRCCQIVSLDYIYILNKSTLDYA